MSSHITQKKPSITQRFLHQLGLVDIHTKVNCWFCNQDSYILAGTRNTKDHWFCTLCENTNAIDEHGEIIDPSPFLMEQTHEDPPTRQTTSISNDGRELCENCQQGYSIIYQVMSEYLPDESDPIFYERQKSTERELQRLHNKYQLCEACETLVEKVLNDKARNLKFENISNLVVKSMSKNNVTKRPTRTQYYIKGFIWYLTQIATLLFVYYSTLHQPQNEIKDWSLRNTLSIGSLTNILISWRYYIDPATINSYFSTKMQSYRYLARCFLVPGDLDCTWSVSDNITFIFIANLLSIKAIDWQYKMTPLVYEKVKNFDTYKKMQWVLYLLRFVLVVLIAIGMSWKVVWSTMILYVTILVISNKMITITASFKCENIYKKVHNTFVALEEQEEEEPAEMEDIEMSIVSEEPINTDHELSSIINRMQHL